MRIRATKPEFWTSKTIAALPWDVRLVLKGLESYVDDNGVGKDDLALIASDVFPRDLVASPPETLARLSEAISMLVSGGLVARYEVDGEALLYIDKWNKLQRIDKPAKGRYRRPDGTLEYSEDVNRDTYRSPRETVASPPVVPAPVTGEQGNRGTVSSSPIASAIPDEQRDDVERLCHRLASRIEANGVTRPKQNKAWRDAARLLIDKDGHTEAQVAWVIDWATADEFWRANILSMPTLRAKFDQLVLKARGSNVRQLRTDDHGQPILPPLPSRSPWGN